MGGLCEPIEKMARGGDRGLRGLVPWTHRIAGLKFDTSMRHQSVSISKEEQGKYSME